ncbi:MAG TPA: DUF748 domain-containing protein [Woeseiaceae bacterium]|nr:DUF748 domain-containing protein [Woeseiaceae bacterium]
MKLTRNIVIVAAVILAVAVIVRALLPLVVERYVNDRLADMGDYRGHVANVDIALIRGAYELHDLTVVKKGSSGQQPFLAMPHLDVSIKWSELFEGQLVGEIQMHNPVLNMIQGERADETQLGAGVNWVDQVSKLFPFRFNRVEVIDGTATFRAPGIQQEESLTLHRLNALLSNLTNVEKSNDPTFAGFEVRAIFGQDAPLSISGHANPLSEVPTFDVNLSLEGARLVDVNPWLEKFLNVDAEQGVFSMYAELAAADGRFEGYIKPILENAEIFRLDEPSTGPLQKAWEAVVDAVGEILEDPKEEQVATQIPFEGELENPDAGLMAAAVNLLRNAFVAAFTHSLEGTVTLEDVESEREG